MKFSPELIKGSTKNIILASLSEEEMYGYQIIKTIRERSKESFDFGEGSIYPALHSLEKAHFISSKWVSQTDAPDRKYYRITRKGRKFLTRSVKEWNDFSSAIDALLKHVKQIASL